MRVLMSNLIRYGLASTLSLVCVFAIYGCRDSDKAGNSSPARNPTPSILWISPSHAVAGKGGFTLTIHGSGFMPGSQARWNEFTRAARYVSSGRIEITVPAEDVAAAGSALISVVNPPPGGGSSQQQVFRIYQNPVVSGLSPAHWTAGDIGFTLNVAGSGFTSSSVVYWNGSIRNTQLINSTSLAAKISDRDVASAGTAQVKVVTAVPNSSSNELTFSIHEQASSIFSLSPDSRSAGSGAFILTVSGSGFGPSSTIFWNGAPRETIYLGSGQLTAEITAKDISSPGAALVRVASPSGEDASKCATFSITAFQSDWQFLGAPAVNGISDPRVVQVAVDREDSRILYVNGYRGLYVTRDGGLSWTLAAEAQRPGSVGMIAQDPGTVDRVFYGQANNLHVSTDRGVTWTLLSMIDLPAYFMDLAVSRFDPHTIYAGTGGSLFYRSRDDGATWQAFPYGSWVGELNFAPYALAEDPVDGALYIGGEFSEKHPHPPEPFLRSTDGGETWVNLTPTEESFMGMVTSIQIDPVSQKVYVLPEGNVIHTSTDQGATWRRAQNWYLHAAFLRDPFQQNRFFGGLGYYKPAMEGGAFISTDDAETFHPFGLEGFAVSQLALSGDGRLLFAASYENGIFVTEVRPPSQPLPALRRAIPGRTGKAPRRLS